MTEMLTDLMEHLQSVNTNHPGDDGRLMVAVPTTSHSIEHFEVREVHHDGPSVVLFCQSREVEENRSVEEIRSQDELPRTGAKRRRACVHNDYADLC
jgi:hypothetical protein